MVQSRIVYARRSAKKADGTWTGELLHRVILGMTDPDITVDHEDHDGLNCQRYNMRIASRSQNSQNRRKSAGTSSHFKGVVWFNRDRVWQAGIRVNDKKTFLGNFVSEIDAATAYDVAARKLFGEFAHINFS